MKTKLFVVGLVMLAALAGITFAALSPVPKIAAQNTLCYMTQGGAKWGCDTGGMFAPAWLRVPRETTVTVTSAQPLTPTGTFMPIQAASNLTISTIYPITPTTGANYAMPGDLLIVQNVNTFSIGISNSTTVNLSADLTLGQDDTLVLMWTGSGWIELSKANN
jgi:hypothetical protein